MLRSQLIDTKSDLFKSDLFNAIGESWKKTYGVIMNSFHELEPSYEELFKTSMKIKTWSVGPFSLWFNRDISEKAQRSKFLDGEANDERIIINWLDSKEKNSILYVSLVA